MRITKKFAGDASIGKRVFTPCKQTPENLAERAAARVFLNRGDPSSASTRVGFIRRPRAGATSGEAPSEGKPRGLRPRGRALLDERRATAS